MAAVLTGQQSIRYVGIKCWELTRISTLCMHNKVGKERLENWKVEEAEEIGVGRKEEEKETDRGRAE